jgi:hypothetical protein
VAFFDLIFLILILLEISFIKINKIVTFSLFLLYNLYQLIQIRNILINVLHQENLHVPTIFRFPIRAVNANSSAKSVPTVLTRC